MSRFHKQADQCVVLVKAMPHRSSNYFETVCCAGVGHDSKWRRLYPVPFRVLQERQKFARWHWLSYEFTTPKGDRRTESQKVIPESINVGKKLKEIERHALACLLTRESTADAEQRGETLTLIEPSRFSFDWERKSPREIEIERERHAFLANQLSMIDVPTNPIEPCPFKFIVDWAGPDGTAHSSTCDDWETSATFFRRRAAKGEVAGLLSMRDTYAQKYFESGMRLALGTHSKRSKQWLLVGILRVNSQPQKDLFS